MALTRDEVLALQAGKEIDALIARHVFGWEFRQPQGRYSCCICQRCGRHTDECFGEYECNWSDNIAAAWQVVDKLKSGPTGDGFAWTWGVEIAWIEDMGRAVWNVIVAGHEVEADSAPLAICQAALLAVREGRP